MIFLTFKCGGEDKAWSFFNSLDLAKREEYQRRSARARDAAARSMDRACMACTTCTRRK